MIFILSKQFYFFIFFSSIIFNIYRKRQQGHDRSVFLYKFPFFLFVLVLNSSFCFTTSHDVAQINYTEGSDHLHRNRWPYVFATLPPLGFYDCLYLYYACTDNHGNWPNNKDSCLTYYNVCEESYASTGSATSTTQYGNGSTDSLNVAVENDSTISTNVGTSESITFTEIATPTSKTTAESIIAVIPVITSTSEKPNPSSKPEKISTTVFGINLESEVINPVIKNTTSPSPLFPPFNKNNTFSSSSLGQVSSCEDILKINPKLAADETIKYKIFQIQLGPRIVDVSCDMTSNGGGWTIIQRRGDFGNPPDFFLKKWESYRSGFGDPLQDHWIGLDNIFDLTHRLDGGPVDLIINLQDFDNNETSLRVFDFRLGNKESDYRFFYKKYSNRIGKSLPTKGTKFSTIDRDNDMWSKNCAERFSGAWWYSACHNSNLNGLYLRGNHSSFGDGVNWYHWKGYHYSLKFTEMKVRSRRFRLQ